MKASEKDESLRGLASKILVLMQPTFRRSRLPFYTGYMYGSPNEQLNKQLKKTGLKVVPKQTREWKE